MTAWYYSDIQRNRLGPVAASDLAELHAHGQLQPGTLVWREGLGVWAPWHEVMHEVLGAPPPAAPALAVAAAAAAEDRRPLFAVPNDEPALAVAGGYNPYQVVDRVQASPYAAPQAALRGNAGAVMGGEVVYAGFWKRFAGYVIDGFVVGIPGALLQVLIAGVVFGGMAAFSSNPGEALGTAAGVLGLLLMYLSPMALAAAYFGVMHASSHQASLGKMAVGIKVTDEYGEAISFWRGFGRYFGLLLACLPVFIGVIIAGFTERKRGLHDMICGTLVVDRWAFTAHPERQRRELGAVTIVIMALGALGILAYIALIVFAVSLAASAGR
jgi:uncharacterized RDD family membrane protein YckC